MIRKRLRQLKRLSIKDWRLLLASLVLLPLTALSLQLLGLRRTHSVMIRLANDPKNCLPEVDQVNESKQVARIVSIAANHGPYHANCLKKSVLIWWLLARKGIHAEIRIGAQTDTSGFRAHAWVEYQGDVLNDRQDIATQYAPFDSFLIPDNMQFL